MKEYLKRFSIGVFMLIISYICVFLVDGEEIYLAEVLKLTDVKYLAVQAFYSGLTYVIVLGTIEVFNTSFDNNWKEIAKCLVKYAILGVIILGIYFISKNKMHVMDNEVGALVIGLGIITMIMGFVTKGIHYGVENHKINEALKEKNASKEK